MSFSAVGLHNPKSSVNVGAALRACFCYGAAMMAVSGRRGQKHVGHSATDTVSASLHMPVVKHDNLHDLIPHDCVPVAVELVPSAVPLFDYVHPDRAFYIFGPEDGTLGKSVLSWCRDIIYIPMAQPSCMNLAATVNVVLYDRAMKRSER